jgi:PTS system cellobiose-specific IIB component
MGGAMAKYRVLLVCAAGMSSSLLEASTVEAAKNKGHEMQIRAVPVSEMTLHDFEANPVDIILVAPQVSYKRRSIAQMAEPLGIAVQGIDPVTYGMVDGEKLFEQIVRAVTV